MSTTVYPPILRLGLLLAALLLPVSRVDAQLLDSLTITSASTSCTASNCLEVDTRGVRSLGVGVAGSGTYTIVAEGTRDNGATWVTLSLLSDASPDSLPTSITAAGGFSVRNSGFTAIRLRASALSSGTPVVTAVRGELGATQAAGGGGSGVSDIDDSSFTVGTDDLTPAGLLFDDVTPDSVDEGDVGVPRMSANRNAYVQIRDAAGNERGLNVDANGAIAVTDGGTSLTVDGTVAVTGVATESTLAGVLTSADFAAAFGTAGTADTQVLSVQGISGGTALPVSAASLPLPTGAATESTLAGMLTSATFAAAFGTAGTPDSQVISVQGISGGTALPVSDNGSTLSIDDGGGIITVDGSISCSNCTGTGASDVDDSSFTLGTDSVAPAGFLFDDVTPDSVDEGDVGLARMSANRVPYAIIRDGASGAERGVSVTANNELLVELGAGSATIGVLGAGDADIGNVDLELAGTAVSATNPVAVRLSDGSAFVQMASDWTASSAVGTSAPGQMLEAKDFDGAALPLTAAAAEGDAIPAAGSLYGVQYVMPVSEDGSSTALFRLHDGTDVALVDGSGNLQVTGTVTVTDGAGALNTIIDSGTVTTVSTVTSLSQFAGNAINLGSGAIGTGTLRMTVATDDPVNDAAVKLDANLVAHDAADAGNPLKIGYKAIAYGTNPTSVAAGDRTDAYANRAGIPFVQTGHPNLIREEVTIADADGAQANVAVVTVSAGTKIIVYDAYAVCANTNTGDVSLRLGLATATLPSVSTTGAAGIILSVPAFDANTGIVSFMGGPVVGGDDEDLRLTIDDPAGGSCRIVYSYATIES